VRFESDQEGEDWGVVALPACRWPCVGAGPSGARAATGGASTRAALSHSAGGAIRFYILCV